MSEFQISSTMKSLKSKNLKGEYVVIRIGDKTYSTSFGEIKTGKDIDRCVLQKVDTVGIGIQDNLWVKGKLTEKTNHEKIEPLPFEINIYTNQGDIETPEGKKDSFDAKEWDKNTCEYCGKGHLYCEECKHYTWSKKDEN